MQLLHNLSHQQCAPYPLRCHPPSGLGPSIFQAVAAAKQGAAEFSIHGMQGMNYTFMRCTIHTKKRASRPASAFTGLRTLVAALLLARVVAALLAVLAGDLISAV